MLIGFWFKKGFVLAILIGLFGTGYYMGVTSAGKMVACPSIGPTIHVPH